MLKAPLDNLTKSLAVDLGPRAISVNTVRRASSTPIWLRSSSSNPDGQAFALSKQALKRIGQPEDVAEFVTFLA
jgi:3-oxoacyl-[acyl-carrier protein] reductase